MKKFKCVIVRKQYQTVVVEAEDLSDAMQKARFFNPNKDYEQYVELYDINELPAEPIDPAIEALINENSTTKE
jgi:hypothetical protein